MTFYRDNRVKYSEILKGRITFHTFQPIKLQHYMTFIYQNEAIDECYPSMCSTQKP